MTDQNVSFVLLLDAQEVILLVNLFRSQGFQVPAPVARVVAKLQDKLDALEEKVKGTSG